MRIELPEKVSLNVMYAGVHWRRRKDLADGFHFAVLAAARKSKIEKIPKAEYPVHMEYIFFVDGKLDVSNTGAMTKLVEDGLVRAGILEADDRKFVRKITTSTEPGRKNMPAVEVVAVRNGEKVWG